PTSTPSTARDSVRNRLGKPGSLLRRPLSPRGGRGRASAPKPSLRMTFYDVVSDEHRHQAFGTGRVRLVHARNAASATNPTRLCVPSQKGLLEEKPQRQRAHLAVVTSAPSAPVMVTGPRRSSGPSFARTTRSGPSPSGGVAPWVPRRPSSVKASRWLLSQNGLFRDRPHR